MVWIFGGQMGGRLYLRCANKWVAADKFPLHLRPDDFDVREMIYSPTETEEYNKTVTTPVGSSK